MKPELPVTESFADRLIGRCRQLGHPLCAGLDPHLQQLPPLFRRGSMTAADPQTAAAVADYFAAFIPRLQGRVSVVKPQSAFFEQLGWPGVKVLAGVCALARQHGLLVLLDAKRGDIGSTAAAYAGYLDPAGPWQADALTVNPYLGGDSLAPFSAAAAAYGAGLFVLVKTSNPGSGDFQDRLVDGEPLFARIAASLAPLAADLRGASGWSSLGAVVGATYPAQATRIRELLPQAVFLIPGYGAQGGAASDAVASFVAGPAGREGGIVSSSRALLFPPGSATDHAATWEAAIDAALTRASDELGAAVS